MTHPVHVVVEVGDPSIRMGLLLNLRVDGYDVVETTTGGQLPPLVDGRLNLLVLDAKARRPSDWSYLSAHPPRSVVLLCEPESQRELAARVGPAVGGVFVKPFALRELLACIAELAAASD
jgi:AmiR/NasT family two-component response regulator